MASDESLIVLLAAAVSAAGVALAMLASRLAGRIADVMTLVSGCVLLAVALLRLAPDAIEHGGAGALALLAVGAGLGAALEAALRASRARVDAAAGRPHEGTRRAAVLGVAALAAHSTVDGAVYAAAFGHDHGSGVLASAGLMLHEGPEGVVAALLCLQAGWRPPIAAAAAVAASSLTTPLGWGLASLLDGAGHGVVDAAFALSAGLLVWVGGHLLIAGARAVAQTVSRGGDRGV